MDVLADSINTIKVYEHVGKDACIIRSTKMVKALLDLMKRYGYIADYQEFKDGKFNKLNVRLSKKINSMGIIKPRFAVRLDEYQKYETRYIPSKDFGILVLSTSNGIMTNREAKEKKLGGRLIAYVY